MCCCLPCSNHWSMQNLLAPFPLLNLGRYRNFSPEAINRLVVSKMLPFFTSLNISVGYVVWGGVVWGFSLYFYCLVYSELPASICKFEKFLAIVSLKVSSALFSLSSLFAILIRQEA